MTRDHGRRVKDRLDMLVNVFSMGSRNNFGRYEGKLSSVEVRVGAARGDAEEKSEVVTTSP